MSGVMTRAEAPSLLSAHAVRRSAHRMLALAQAGELDDWRVDLDRLPAAADFVAGVVRERYPGLDPPLHARWRHFVFAGRDLAREILDRRAWADSPSLPCCWTPVQDLAGATTTPSRA
jgi:hypothetical protein